MKFVDSNVLVYAADDTDVEKHERALSIIERAMRGEFIISAQVLNEFSSVLYKKLRKSDDEVERYLKTFSLLSVVPVKSEYTLEAVRIKRRYDIQFFDSVLLATAVANECDEFWSEDLNDGQMYGSVKAINPFK